MSNYMTNKSRVLNAFRGSRSRGKKWFTAQELVDRLKLTSKDTVYTTISQLRSEGYGIIAQKNRQGVNQYSLQG